MIPLVLTSMMLGVVLQMRPVPIDDERLEWHRQSVPWRVRLADAGDRSLPWRRQRRARRAEAGVTQLVIGVVIGLRAGSSIRLAIADACHSTNHIGDPGLVGVADAMRSGREFERALNASLLPSTHVGREFIDIVMSGHRSGTSVTKDLELLVAETRRAQQFDALTRARRLPVKLLLPLVLCVLPAFVLVAIVPLVVSGAAAFVVPNGI